MPQHLDGKRFKIVGKPDSKIDSKPFVLESNGLVDDVKNETA